MNLLELYNHDENIEPNLLNELVGKRIREIRTNLNLSQEAFAEVVGLHRTYIGQIERAEKNMTLKNIHKICHALKIDPKDLLIISKS